MALTNSKQVAVVAALPTAAGSIPGALCAIQAGQLAEMVQWFIGIVSAQRMPLGRPGTPWSGESGVISSAVVQWNLDEPVAKALVSYAHQQMYAGAGEASRQVHRRMLLENLDSMDDEIRAATGDEPRWREIYKIGDIGNGEKGWVAFKRSDERLSTEASVRLKLLLVQERAKLLGLYEPDVQGDGSTGELLDDLVERADASESLTVTRKSAVVHRVRNLKPSQMGAAARQVLMDGLVKEATGQALPPVKRGRGRPRKYPRPEAAAEAFAAVRAAVEIGDVEVVEPVEPPEE